MKIDCLTKTILFVLVVFVTTSIAAHQEVNNAVKPPLITVDGVRLNVVDAGQGKPVVLLHPVPGFSISFDRVVPSLAQTYHVMVPDLRGHGRSEKPKGDYSIPAQANSILKLLDTKGIESAAFVGNSYGGILALYLACHHPKRVKSLVLTGMNSYTDFRFPFKARIMSSSLGVFLIPFVRQKLFERTYLEQFYDPALIKREHLDNLWSALKEPNGFWCTWKQSHQIDFELLEPFLGNVNTPVLLIWGKQDKASPLKWAQKLEQDIPGARLAVIENCGHFPPVERPGEFSVLTMEFLSEVYK